MKTWTDVLVRAIMGLLIFCALPGGTMRADAASDPCPNGFLAPGNAVDAGTAGDYANAKFLKPDFERFCRVVPAASSR